MAVFMRDDVALGERARRRAEAALELVEEAEVDPDPLVVRAVERPDLGRRGAAARLDRTAEERCLGRHVRLTGRLELRRPVGLDAVHVGDDPAVVTGVRVGPGLAVL